MGVPEPHRKPCKRKIWGSKPLSPAKTCSGKFLLPLGEEKPETISLFPNYFGFVMMGVKKTNSIPLRFVWMESQRMTLFPAKMKKYGYLKLLLLAGHF